MDYATQLTRPFVGEATEREARVEERLRRREHYVGVFAPRVRSFELGKTSEPFENCSFSDVPAPESHYRSSQPLVVVSLVSPAAYPARPVKLCLSPPG